MTIETTTTAEPAQPADTGDAPGLLGTETPTAEGEGKTAEQLAAEAVAKPPEEKPAPPAEVKYEFTPPEGVEFDAPHLEKFTALAKELKLEPEAAQKIVGIAGEMEKARIEQHAETVKGWLESVKTDKELGGDKLPENLAVAKKTFSLLPEAQATELKSLLNQTGLEAHPVFFRLFHAVGKALSEDKFVPGGRATAPAKSTAERLYPNTPSA